MKAKLIVNKNYEIGKIDDRIYGSFIEHLGRAVYGGIYEPTHESADDMGFRGDVIDMVKQLNVPIVRYPGGNFVSGYEWEDGTGDKTKRPKRTELAWGTVETNEVGIDDFQEWAKRAGTDIMMAVNLGTRGPADAQHLLEYCNLDTDTKYAKMRKENGFEKPFGIKTWCLGNEMDGPWQICGKTAEEYGRIACETAKIMKFTDSSIELVACGSSCLEMPTFGDWELTVLEHTYDYVDYISMHQYYRNTKNNAPEFLGKSVIMNRFIKDVASLCDAVKAKKHSDKTINISFDEWNVWYHVPTAEKDAQGNEIERWLVAPHQLEDIYTFEDALVVGTLLMTLQNNCDRVKMACLAQLVNVIAPIMTENGGKAWAQSIFYPFMYGSINGRGAAMRIIKECDSYKTSYADVPYLESSVIHDADNRTVTVFAVNRSLDEDMSLDLLFESLGDCKITEHIELYHDDLKATNSAEKQSIAPVKREIPDVSSQNHSVLLKKHSYNVIKFTY
jgi:alpha-N-arabinofuranosidase